MVESRTRGTPKWHAQLVILVAPQLSKNRVLLSPAVQFSKLIVKHSFGVKTWCYINLQNIFFWNNMFPFRINLDFIALPLEINLSFLGSFETMMLWSLVIGSDVLPIILLKKGKRSIDSFSLPITEEKKFVNTQQKSWICADLACWLGLVGVKK